MYTVLFTLQIHTDTSVEMDIEAPVNIPLREVFQASISVFGDSLGSKNADDWGLIMRSPFIPESAQQLDWEMTLAEAGLQDGCQLIISTEYLDQEKSDSNIGDEDISIASGPVVSWHPFEERNKYDEKDVRKEDAEGDDHGFVWKKLD